MTADLSTRYLGLDLANPVVASPSPVTGDIDQLRRLEDAGIAAVVLPSLFEEEIEHETAALQQLDHHGAGAFAEAAEGYLPPLTEVETAASRHVDLVSSARKALSVPVIASLNGVTPGGWVRYASRLEDAGAHALELNIYLVATDPTHEAAEVEQRYAELVAAVGDSVSIPLSVKIGPYFSSLTSLARRLEQAGADGLVLFNRFYQPDIDLELLQVVPSIVLSSPTELRLPLRWTAVLSEILDGDLAVTTGVHHGDDVLKALLVGANVAMMASALLKEGPEHVAAVLSHVQQWLTDHGYASVDQLRGAMSMSAIDRPEQYVRANYIQTLHSYPRPQP
ncbi:MAG: dihydroorotate dehydrogenase-like protein [Acidimicrobiia bacterium]|nr:dihydroorotate dehydrogenase-like protein [Acidimicrobiia bacterium]